MAMNKSFPKIVALYLPQFYETEYNNKWWGKGYTEWVACKRAQPLYKGHYQPRIPLNENYYNLTQKDSIRWQMKIAKEYGIDGFAIYQYYSCGSKLLDVPTEIIRDDSTLDLPFFLYWANASWQKAWFGQDQSIVWEQKYGNEDDWKKQFDYCLSFFVDKRYIKIEGKPVYAIYNPWAIPEIDRFIELWDTWAKESGLPGIYFVKTLSRKDSADQGKFSAIVTREPNYTFGRDEDILEKAIRVVSGRIISFINRKILFKFGKGIVMTKASYDKIWEKILNRSFSYENVFLGTFCDWDNSPRKSYNSIIMQGATVDKFSRYFDRLIRKAIEIKSPMIVINAWNEWAESAYLEPDTENGFGYLEAIKEAKYKYMRSNFE